MPRHFELERAEARFFRSALGQPTAESHALLRRRGLREVLAGFLSEEAAAELPSRLRVPVELAQLEADYRAAFVDGLPAPPVPLLERHWCGALPPGEIAAANARFYEAVDVTAKLALAREPPDHLVAQLSFVELALWAIDEREARGGGAAELRWVLGDFVHQHLVAWVPAAAAVAVSDDAKGGRTVVRPVFAALLVALTGWVARLTRHFPASTHAGWTASSAILG